MSSQVSVIIWLNVVLVTLTMAALSSRLGRRVFMVGQWNWQDALITLAAISATIFSVLQMVGTRYGLGEHITNVDLAGIPTLAKLIMVSNTFYFLCNWAVKHALLLFYTSIARSPKYLYSIYFMHFVAFGFGSSSILVNLFQCRPFNKAWRGAEVQGYCVNLNIFFYCNASIMLATDLVLYVMPVVFTWNLQLRRPQRIGLNALFGLGGLVLAASAARMNSVHLFVVKPDFTWRFANAMIWSVIENHLAIVVACAPSVKVVALILFPRLASSLRSVVSKVTPSSSSRSRSRASIPYSNDLESGTRKSDRLKPTPSSTPLPSPAFTEGSGGSRTRTSSGFSKWFKGPASPVMGSGDSMEDAIYEERQGKDVKMADIRVQHDISVESNRQSSDV